jgi:hypothetical protein
VVLEVAVSGTRTARGDAAAPEGLPAAALDVLHRGQRDLLASAPVDPADLQGPWLVLTGRRLPATAIDLEAWLWKSDLTPYPLAILGERPVRPAAAGAMPGDALIRVRVLDTSAASSSGVPSDQFVYPVSLAAGLAALASQTVAIPRDPFAEPPAPTPTAVKDVSWDDLCRASTLEPGSYRLRDDAQPRDLACRIAGHDLIIDGNHKALAAALVLEVEHTAVSGFSLMGAPAKDGDEAHHGGIQVRPGPAGQVWIHDNVISGEHGRLESGKFARAGIEVDVEHSTRDIVVRGNRVTQIAGKNDSDDAFAIHVQVRTDHRIDGLWIVDNAIDGASTGHSAAIQVDGTARHFTIRGNTLRGYTRQGIAVVGSEYLLAGRPEEGRIAENRLCSPDSEHAAIELDSAADVAVTGNAITTATDAIEVTMTGRALVQNVSVTENELRPGGDTVTDEPAISVGWVRKGIVRGIVIDGNRVAPADVPGPPLGVPERPHKGRPDPKEIVGWNGPTRATLQLPDPCGPDHDQQEETP